MTTVAFRVDADEAIGLGHVMRCMALALALAERSARVIFVSATLPASLRIKLERLGIVVRHIDRRNDEVEDARLTLAALAEKKSVEWICVDHYGLGARWERAVTGAGMRVAAIDDYATRAHDCDLVIDHNVGVSRDDYAERVAARARFCLGPAHALLRPEFARSADVRPRTRLGRLHVAFGGADPTRETEKVLDALAADDLRALPADIVLGAANPRADSIRTITRKLTAATLHVDAERVAELLDRADLAIGAAGVSALERCVKGVPTLLVAVASNQIRIAQALASRGAAVLLGDSPEVSSADIAGALRELLTRPARLAALSRAAAAVCDGSGARRVADAMLTSRPFAEKRTRS